jgi:hypothetical protein
MVTCDFRANRVTSFSITEQGAAYITKQEADICRTSNNTFRPIDVKLGPDGALYIADWSNPIINHGEVDFRDPRRDREHGRIWRVSVKGKAALKKPELAKASNAALLNQLLSANHFESSQATRLLVEKGSTAVAADLKTWTAKLKTEKEQLAALWIHQSLNVPAPELLTKLLAAPDGRIRAAAVRALSFVTTMPAKPVLVADANGTSSTPTSRTPARASPRATPLRAWPNSSPTRTHASSWRPCARWRNSRPPSPPSWCSPPWTPSGPTRSSTTRSGSPSTSWRSPSSPRWNPARGRPTHPQSSSSLNSP